MLLLNVIILGTAQAQNIPAGMRVEVAEDETDHGEYSIFEYKDSDDAESFGYYLSLGRVTDFLGADEILGMEVKNSHEVTIRLGSTTEEALARAYLSKSTLKNLRANFKLDIKLHPKQHRKK